MVSWLSCLTLDFGSGHDPGVVGSSPMSGTALSVEPAWDSFFPSFPLTPPLLAHSLFLSKIKNKNNLYITVSFMKKITNFYSFIKLLKNPVNKDYIFYFTHF